jgi:hypothetical protein
MKKIYLWMLCVGGLVGSLGAVVYLYSWDPLSKSDWEDIANKIKGSF